MRIVYTMYMCVCNVYACMNVSHQNLTTTEATCCDPNER